MKKIRVGIVGGAGYTGGELIRLLINHEEAEMVFVHSKSNAGQFLYTVHRDLTGETTQKFTSALSDEIDVLFLCVGHHEAKKFLQENEIKDPIRIIDLSQDFRIGEFGSIGRRSFVYGLPEINREHIKTATNIANPGCFATAIQLGLLPLAKAGLLREIHTTGITGSTGAGQALSETSHFSWRANNVQAYKTLTHQHLREIEQSLAQVGSVEKSALPQVHFVPWRGDFTRGIFVSSTLFCETAIKDLNELYIDFYTGHPFTIINQESIFLKQVVNTNKCMISLERAGSVLVVHSAIDNLLKGASGQAVQNMNLMFGIGETTGLKLKANYF
jgi:N-acetyl-gamma-glutamyl-phosphate reductase